MDALKALISALPSAASSPLALVAYALLVLGWALISLKVLRNKHMLANLEKLPPADRLKALELEMGAVRLKGGLTPDQWIRSQIHLYYFLGFALLCAVAVMIFAIAMVSRREPAGTATADLSVYTPPQPAGTIAESSTAEIPSADKAVNTAKRPIAETGEAVPAAPDKSPPSGLVRAMAASSTFDESGGRAPSAPAERTVSYRYVRRNDTISVFPSMPYLDLLRHGGPIAGFRYWWSPFAWQYPQISAEIVNNTNGSILLNEVVVTVTRSEINLEPILIIEENFHNVGCFDIINEGWGAARNAVLDFDILDSNSCSDQPSLSASPQHLEIAPIVDRQRVAVASFVPVSLRTAELVCVVGKLVYQDPTNAARTLLFRTRVSLVPPGRGAPAPPTYTYDLFLEAGKAGYVKRLPIAQKIAAGDVDHFLLRLGTDKSAHFDLTIAFRGVGGVELPAPRVSLDVFVPRSQSERAQ